MPTIKPTSESIVLHPRRTGRALCIVLWLLAACALGGLTLAALTGCGRAQTPVPSPTAPVLEPTTPAPTPTGLSGVAVPETSVAATSAVPEPTVGAQFIPPEGYMPTPVPIIYKMFDWGTDYQKTNPEYGPIGSIQFVMWEDINPARGEFNWDKIDRELAKEANLKVTLLDGTEIPKPVVIQVFAHLSSAPNWKATFYDGTPGWVYDAINSENPGDPRPIVNGKKVGHKLEGCSTVAVLPMYDSPTWRKAYYDMVRAFGQHYNGHPQVTAIVVNTGLDGETQPVKDWYCDWNTLLDQQAGSVRYRFGQFMLEAMDVYREAFPNKYIFINNAPGGGGTRQATSDYAAGIKPPVGLKHSGMWIDLDSHQGYGDFVGSWDMIGAYSMTLPIWLESPFGLGGSEHRYWALIAGLHYHPDAVDLHPEFLPQSDPEWLRFTTAHLGRTINDTPDVWTVLRDAEYPLVSWGKGGVSGHVGDWTFWLYRQEEAPQSGTERVWRDAMPAAKDHIYSRQARKTKQSADQIYMSFDIDDGYPFVAQKPSALDGGNVSYRIAVTILNQGADTFSLEYRTWDGGIASQTRRKGPGLGPRDDWVTVEFEVTDGYLDNNLPGGADFRISCERDGDEYIHRVLVEGLWGVPPTSTATPPPTVTPPPTATSPPPPSSPPPATAEPVAPHDPAAILLQPADDTFLDAWSSTSTQDAAPQLSARQGNVRLPLLRFDLSGIPIDAQVTTAVLALNVRQRTNNAHMTVLAHKLLRPWDGRYATWHRATASDNWAVAGCGDPLRDISMVAIDWAELIRPNGWCELDITGLVREWVKHPESNYGLALRSSSAASVQYDFYSVDHSQKDLRPRLEVVWSPSAATPVPPTSAPTAESTAMPAATATMVPTIVPPTGAPTSPSTPVPDTSATATAVPGPTTVILRQGEDYQGVSDAFLDGWAPDANYEKDIKLGARQGGVRVPVLHFDLSGIPAHSSVRRAVLRLYATDATDTSRIELNILRVLRPWDPTLVTWHRATATEAWAQPGALDAERDRSPQIHASAPFQAERTWIEWDIHHLVQEWVANPAENYGLLMLAEGNVPMQVNLASSSWVMPDFRPQLEIEYLPAAPTATVVASDTPTYTPVPVASATPARTLLPSSGEYTFQQGLDGYAGCEDTFIDRWYPNRNYVDDDRLVVRQGDYRSTLLRYDVRALPPGSRITKARLLLYLQYRSGAHVMPAEVYGIARPWVAGEATYQRASRARAWFQDGANGLGQDLVAPVLDTVSLSGQGKWVAFDVTRMAQTWVNYPDYNHGIIIKGKGGTAVEYQFIGSEWQPVPGLRPRLVVSWESGPTPTAASTSATSPVELTSTPTPLAATSTPQAIATATPEASPPPDEEIRLVLQQGQAGYTGASDTYLDGWAQQAVRGGDATFSVRQGNIRVGLVRFDLADLPKRAWVENAKLKLWIAYASNKGQVSLRAYRLTRPWDEGGATWLRADQEQDWAAPGAGSMGADYDGSLVGQALIWGSRKWVEIDLTPALRYWMEHPEKNYGVLLQTEGGVYVEHQFASSDRIEVAQRPKLAIVYLPSRSTATSPTDGLLSLRLLVPIGAFVVLVVLLLTVRRPRKPEEETDPVD